MTAKPLTPAVVVRIDQNSRLSILQDEGVQVVLADERVDPDFVTLLPRRNQTEEILLVLGEKYPVSLKEDHAGTAANALAQLYRQRILIGQLEPGLAGGRPTMDASTVQMHRQKLAALADQILRGDVTAASANVTDILESLAAEGAGR